jgi:hypothetical protein
MFSGTTRMVDFSLLSQQITCGISHPQSSTLLTKEVIGISHPPFSTLLTQHHLLKARYNNVDIVSNSASDRIVAISPDHNLQRLHFEMQRIYKVPRDWQNVMNFKSVFSVQICHNYHIFREWHGL